MRNSTNPYSIISRNTSHKVSLFCESLLDNTTHPKNTNWKHLVKSCSNNFLLWYSDCPKYNRILNNREYFRDKGINSELVFMSPSEYLQKCAEGFGCKLDQSNAMIKPENVEKYKNMIQDGHKFPCPILSYNKMKRTFLQEGRHRAKACDELGFEKIPVWVITTESNANEDLENLPLLDNNTQQLSRIMNMWRNSEEEPAGFIRNWNFCSRSRAEELVNTVNGLALNCR